MTLIFALLREDHIIFASDRRHVQGHEDARYINDDCWKTQAILGNRAMLGFAGDDLTEQVIEELKRNGGSLEGGCVSGVADSVCEVARKKVNRIALPAPVPPMEFLIAGFLEDGGKNLATCFTLSRDNQMFLPHRYSFSAERGHCNFHVIGRHRHGALYILLKCAGEMTTVEAGTRLAYFTLCEVGKYDIGVGGPPQVCIIRPNQKVEDRSDNLQEEKKWVAEKSEEIRKIITGVSHERDTAC